MKTIQIISILLSVFITAPIWYYLLYNILKAVNASELMFFLFWIYLPVGIFNIIITKIAEKDEK